MWFAVLVADRFDRVFWSGDLNYRINANRKMADMLLVQQMAEVKPLAFYLKSYCDAPFRFSEATTS